MFSTWLSRRVHRKGTPRQRGRPARPLLEVLENRWTPATHTWTGGAGVGNLLWSNPANWSGGVPTSGEAGGTLLVFPSVLSSLKVTTDDLSSLAVDQITFSDTGYSINGTGGNSLTLPGITPLEVDDGTATMAILLSGPGSLTKTGPGTLNLALAPDLIYKDFVTNTYAGATKVDAGTLRAEPEAYASTRFLALPITTAVTVAAGATLELDGYTYTIASLAGAGRLVLKGGYYSSLHFGNDLDTTFSGTITGVGNLYKEGTGAFTLSPQSGANDYSGPTHLLGGTLRMGAVNALPGDTTVDISQATFDLNDFNTTVGTLIGSGTVKLGKATLTLGSSAAPGGLNGTTAQITGTGGLSKINTASLKLGGDCLYTGPTVIDGGRLEMDGNLLSSLLTVNAGGSLWGTGTVGTAAVSGAVFPGGHSATFGVGYYKEYDYPGTLNTGNIQFAAGSSFAVLMQGGMADQWSQLQATGVVDLSGRPTLIVTTNNFNPAPSATFPIMTSTGGLTGTFAGLPDGAYVTAAGGTVFQIHYTADAVTLTRNSPNLRWVAQVYQDLLHRAPEAEGHLYWDHVLDLGFTRTQVAQMVAGSDEYRMLQVQQVYQTYLHRPADPEGLRWGLSYLGSGGTLEGFAAAVAGSPEFFQGQAGGTEEGFLGALYQAALGRSVDPVGQAFFGDELARGTGLDQVAAQVVTSLEYRQILVQGLYHDYLGRPAESEGLTYFVNLLRQGWRDEAVIAVVLGSDEYFARA